MTLIVAIIIARIATPFLVIRWPFWGAVATLAADTFDFTLLNAVGNGPLGGENYQRFDKIFDLYALFFFLYASSKLTEVRARKILSGLFSWRILGIFAFEATGIRQFLFFAPNIFEYFYLLIFGTKKFSPATNISSKKFLTAAFFIAAVPKVIFEYIMHFREYPLGIGSIFKALRSWIGL